jgi:hypothetical protein
MTALRPGFVLLAVLALAGCTTTAPNAGAGSGDGDDGTSSAADCSSVSGSDYELFIDPRLTVDPQLDVYPLEAGDRIDFADTGAEGVYTTYGYDSYYIDDATAFPNSGAIFVGAEDSGTFSLEGPQAPSGVDGGPYPGIIEITATTDAGSTIIARLCVVFARSE